jgi:hypothetical protein
MKTGTILITSVAIIAIGSVGLYAYNQKLKEQLKNPDNKPGENGLTPDGKVPPEFKIGQMLYANQSEAIRVNQAKKKGGTWEPTNDHYGNFVKGKKVGVIEHAGIVPQGMDFEGQPYYIVRECTLESFSVFGLSTPTAFCKYGVVIQSQVTNKK